MKNRIKELRTSEGLSMQAFAERLNLSKGTISLWESGERNIPNKMTKVICKEFGVNETWLLTGEGEMKAPPSREQEIADLATKLLKINPDDPADQLLYDTIMHLKEVPKSVWEDFLEFIKEEIPKLNLK